jgi:hypothetical protein
MEAISKLLANQHNGFRYLAKQNICKIISKKHSRNSKKSLEYEVLKSIKQKLIDNNLTLTCAGKGKTLVIIKIEELHNKILSFTSESHFKHLNRDPTMKFQRKVKEVIKKCNTIIDKSSKFKYIQIKHQAPRLNVGVKCHKDMAPIRPIINYRNAPSYYIAKITANWLKQNFELPFKYNVKNSIECAERIEELNIQPTC